MTSVGMCCYCINSTDKNKTSHDSRDPSWNLSKTSFNIGNQISIQQSFYTHCVITKQSFIFSFHVKI